MGVSLRLDYLTNDAAYAQKAGEEYDLLTAGNECKTNYIARDWKTVDFTKCESMLSYANSKNMTFRGHVLLWANVGETFYQPAFIRNETDAKKIENFMKLYINQTMSWSNGRIPMWDVVNEAVSNYTNGSLHQSPYAKVDDFICKAFTWARSASPYAELFYNDFNVSSVYRW
jgi:endo-1,4-beta-xylanase